MKISIIIIGDEILLGRVVDTNSSLIARTFTALGFDVAAIRTVGDDGPAIKAAIEAALAEAELVVTTGGLGPTRDDITKTVLMDVFGGELVPDAEVLANVERIFAERGLVLNELTRRQALVPSSCTVLQNRLGTAPLMWFERSGHALVAMPGVPFETRGMLPEVAAKARERFHPQLHVRRAEYTLSGISESALAEHLASFEDRLPSGAHVAYLPSPGRVVLRLDAVDMPEADFESYKSELQELAKPYIAGEGVLSPAEILLARLRRRGYTLATAESCTGGNIAHAVTAVAGCSDVYLGGVVSYANEVKTDLLGVDPQAIAEHGVVSEAVVRAMAEGACRALGSDCAVSTSGIAGPGGATPGKPVGTVWMAAAVHGRTEARLFHIAGDRAAVIEGATARALNLLNSMLDL